MPLHHVTQRAPQRADVHRTRDAPGLDDVVVRPERPVVVTLVKKQDELLVQ